MPTRKKTKARLIGGLPDMRYSIIVVGDTVIIPSRCGIGHWEDFVRAAKHKKKIWQYKCSEVVFPYMQPILKGVGNFVYAGEPDIQVAKKIKAGEKGLRTIFDLTVAKMEGSKK